MISKSFQERLGVREGAVESPHQFNAYMGNLRSRLEAQNHDLCKLADVIICVILYADDAALPADSAE
eukprot:8114875-Karenia_brevis.AAC.1